MYVRTAVFCFLVIVVVDYLCYVEALDENGPGVCVIRQSTKQRRKKTYNAISNKWCGRKKCIIRKFKYETYLTWTNHTICCTGWQYNNEQDVCSAICSIDCNGGTCIAPDKCQCQPPTYLNQNNTCTTPSCNPTCTNSVCHENNTCICNENYTRYNATHCFKCGSGYTADENLNCIPVCEPKCVNGSCTAPNKCSCKPGFQPTSSTTCSPIRCDCVNGECVAGICTCFNGYERVNKTLCAPKCGDCSNGDCVAPNNCTCHRHYTRIGGLCRPICSIPCLYGVCVAPDVCSCNDGYVLTEDRRRCVRPKPCVNCKGFCDNGRCVPWDCRQPLDTTQEPAPTPPKLSNALT